jgi:hypothetical protein
MISFVIVVSVIPTGLMIVESPVSLKVPVVAIVVFDLEVLCSQGKR